MTIFHGQNGASARRPAEYDIEILGPPPAA
jgi:hypothetical protein